MLTNVILTVLAMSLPIAIESSESLITVTKPDAAVSILRHVYAVFDGVLSVTV